MSRYLEIRSADWKAGRHVLAPAEILLIESYFAGPRSVVETKKSSEVALLRYRDSYLSRRILEKVWRNA